MKKIIFITLLIAGFSHAQQIQGYWKGAVNLGKAKLRIAFNITQDAKAYKATMDSPDQGVKGVPVDKTSFENNVLTVQMPKLNLQYSGTLKDEIIEGTLKQNGFSFPLILQKGKTAAVIRPQEPKKPYPYRSKEVKFKNEKAGIILAGELTLPEKGNNFPAVVLISGSGAQNRNEEIFGHKPFLVLSDYLTRKGIAVLRFDDRGTGESTGDFSRATTADFSDDVKAAVNYLQTKKEINHDKIGLIGHSEGGVIAPMIASQSNDIAFIVLLAAPGISADQLLLSQQKALLEASGADQATIERKQNINKQMFDLIKKTTDLHALKTKLNEYLAKVIDQQPDLKAKFKNKQQKQDYIQSEIKQLTSPWFRYFLKYDPSVALKKVTCPVLALGGSKDLQVPAKENLSIIKQTLEKAGNKDITVEELPGLNHLFQQSKTGLPSEYGTIEQTFSPVALSKIGRWILQQTQHD